MIRSILIAALMAGTVAGILFTGIQRIQVTPLIAEAELLENRSETTHMEETPILDSIPHRHSHIHVHEDEQPPYLRLLLTLIANILAGIGFALVVVSGIALTGHKGWHIGLLWGLAGFFVFFVAPSLGLKPKVPGTAAADLYMQQIWWISTVVSSALGLSLLVFTRKTLFKGIGLLLLICPHVVGAPTPEHVTPNAVEQLSEHFIVAAAIANGLFWLILGSLSGLFIAKYSSDS
ncbi:MAG: CbtA family protein [Gammaproteobacteria bacterium]|nr:CbtA family protein [Gammaproteobacteria bacterium]MDH5802170.1 CbtA family protein [Gammaproteobacteria bacterium]